MSSVAEHQAQSARNVAGLADQVRAIIARRRAESAELKILFAGFGRDVANDDQAPARLRDDELAALDSLDELAAPTSKKVTKRPVRHARSSVRSQRGMRRIKAREALDGSPRATGPLTPSSKPKTYSKTYSHPSRAASQPGSRRHLQDLADKRRLPAWRNTTELEKLIFATRATGLRGTSWTFSLNLGPEVIQAANDNAKGFVDYMRRSIARALTRTLGADPGFVLVAGVNKEGRLHCHGALSLDPNHKPAVERALKRLCGSWSDRGDSKAVDLAETRNLDAWGYYMRRNARSASKTLAGPTWSVSHGLTRQARDLYEETRAKVDRKPAGKPVETRQAPPAPTQPASPLRPSWSSPAPGSGVPAMWIETQRARSSYNLLNRDKTPIICQAKEMSR